MDNKTGCIRKLPDHAIVPQPKNIAVVHKSGSLVSMNLLKNIVKARWKVDLRGANKIAGNLDFWSITFAAGYGGIQ